MRNICYLVYIIFSISLISCKSQSTKNLNSSSDSSDNRIELKNFTIDDNFDSFLNLFSEDSTFQISRIVFPIKGKVLELSDESEFVEVITQRNDHFHMDFRVRRKENPDGYTISAKINNNTKATVEIRGIDNGIIMDYYFEKQNGKWMFISYVDSST